MAISVTLLTACGGGGGSTPSVDDSTAGGGGETISDETFFQNIVTNRLPAIRSTSIPSMRAAASATPVSGSVTQSSDVDSSNVTRDRISATATYSDNTLIVSVTNEQADSWGAVSSSDIALATYNILSDTNSGVTYRERAIGKRIGTNGFVAVDVFTDRLSDTDTDYLVGGVWLYVPDGANPNPEIGTFMDGPDDNITPANYLTAEKTDAVYQGDAIGFFLGNDRGTVLTGEFVADVNLTLDFGTNPKISGMLTNLNMIDSTRTVLTPIDGNPTLNLGEASITNIDGGFFSGDTAGTYNRESYAGKWGGQLYGIEAQKVGGTFGSTTTNGANSFVGVFGAYKQ